tara:strand:+ start:1413 stop:1646 length:234 start_codon:yes stop_codon:yes gene_type:complete
MKYLNTLISEKNINTETIFEVEGESGTNFIPLAVVIEYISTMPESMQDKVRTQLVKIDFHNGNVLNFFEYIAKYIAK